MAAFPQFLWIAVLGGIFAFIMAFGIGANDVANAFGTSVAAKTLTLLQAIWVSSIFEFAGAVLLGASVTGTIRGKILKTSYYKSQPEIIMFGNLTSLMIASTWLLIATAYGYPISTTHTIVAALIGFSLAAEGFQSIEWKTASKIFISWFASPTFTGVIAFIFFFATKKLVLTSANPFLHALKVFPLVIFAGISVNLAFILIKANANGAFKNAGDNFNQQVILPVSVGGGAFCGIVFFVLIGPWLSRKVEREMADIDSKAAADKLSKMEAEETTQGKEEGSDEHMHEDGDDNNNMKEKEVAVVAQSNDSDDAPTSNRSSVRKAWDTIARNTYRQDLEAQSFTESARAKEIWDNDDLHYDALTERLFSYLQVFTACMASFAHGSNDVANGIAPFSAILDIYRTGVLHSKAPVQKWILAMGGAGICLGFTLFGYQVIKSLGYKLICMSPSRGFCIELAAALAVSTASFLEIPVSSTQCLVGGTVGAGVAAGGLKNVQWFFFFKVTISWVVTFFVTCIVSAGFFAFCAYSPSLVSVE